MQIFVFDGFKRVLSVIKCQDFMPDPSEEGYILSRSNSDNVLKATLTVFPPHHLQGKPLTETRRKLLGRNAVVLVCSTSER